MWMGFGALGRELGRSRPRPDPNQLGNDVLERLRGVDFVRTSGTKERFDLGQVLENQCPLVGCLPVLVRGSVLDPAEHTSPGALKRTTASKLP